MKGSCKDAWKVVVQHNNRCHRADILIDNVVIEFQHSPISIAEFNERNDFFKKSGLKLAWIFDMSYQYNSESIYFQEYRGTDYLMVWKHSKKIFADIEYLSDNNKDFALWFAYKTESSDLYRLDKVIWSPMNEYGDRIMNKFIVSQYMKIIDYGFDPKVLFFNKKENFKQILQKVKCICEFKIKVVGISGHKETDYICERTNKFGIELFKQYGCSYCKYCRMILQKRRNRKSQWAVYCTYPNQVRKTYKDTDTHPGYECDKAIVYGI